MQSFAQVQSQVSQVPAFTYVCNITLLIQLFYTLSQTTTHKCVSVKMAYPQKVSAFN